MNEKLYISKQKEKILNFAREEFKAWNITKKQLEDVYFYNYFKKTFD